MAGIDLAAADRLQRRAFRDFVAMVGDGAPDSRVVDLDGGVRAAVVPAVPERSIVNSVTYVDAGALRAALDRLASIYDEAGVAAWTVWVPGSDREAIEALESAGHVLDGSPAAMTLDLAILGALPAPDLGDLDWDAEAGPELLGRLNDEAYGLSAAAGIAPALVGAPRGLAMRLYRARAGGEEACVLATIDHEGSAGSAGPDCGVYFVATAPAHRRRGLASRLMLAALAEARARGCATSSLQASAMGEPVYAALGYRTHFRWGMYERRRAGSARRGHADPAAGA